MSTLQGTYSIRPCRRCSRSRKSCRTFPPTSPTSIRRGTRNRTPTSETLLNEVPPPDHKFFTVQTRDLPQRRQARHDRHHRPHPRPGAQRPGFHRHQYRPPTAPASWEYTRDGSFYGQAVTLPTSQHQRRAGPGHFAHHRRRQLCLRLAGGRQRQYHRGQRPHQAAADHVQQQFGVPAQGHHRSSSCRPTSPAGITGRQNVGLPFVDASGNTRTLDSRLHQRRRVQLDPRYVEHRHQQPAGERELRSDHHGQLRQPTAS